MMKKEPVACMLGSSNRQENGEWRESALHVEQKGEVAGAGGRRGAAQRVSGSSRLLSVARNVRMVALPARLDKLAIWGIPSLPNIAVCVQNREVRERSALILIPDNRLTARRQTNR